MSYKHGTYAEITGSRVSSTAESSTVAGYIGTAPVNLIRGFATAGVINTPVKISSGAEFSSVFGKSEDWAKFTLCEVAAQNFEVQNVAPAYFVNVLDPSAHKKSSATSASLVVANSKATIVSDTIIIDTFAIADMVEDTDYTLEYNFDTHTLTVTFLDTVTSPVSASYYEVDLTNVTDSVIVGSASGGVYTGLKAFDLLYQKYNAVLTVLAAPGWSEHPTVYSAMIATVTKLNGHWDGFVNADIPVASTTTIAAALAWKDTNGYNSERSKVYWPQAADGAGRVFHLSTIATAMMLRQDNENDGIPFETVSNKPVTSAKQYFGAGAANQGFDQVTANTLNEKGITTICFWGGNWVMWGPHTAAYTYGGTMDARAIFDVNIRMLEYITNSFQLDHGTDIDEPMTIALKDTILAAENAKLDALVGIGALIGDPVVEFLPEENTDADIINGDFTWNISATNTPPLKSATVRAAYTDDGFQTYYGE